MTRVEFWILNLLSLLLAAVIGFELVSGDRLEEAQNLDRQAQGALAQSGQLETEARRMVERTAQGAARDPALKDLMAKYGFPVTITPVKPGIVAATIVPAPPIPASSTP